MDRPLWQSAAAFAARAHRHGLRKDGRTPYFAHPVRVAMTLAQVFGCSDEATLAAALLHDTIEDTDSDYDDIESGFGPDVAALVQAMTKNKALPEARREREYDGRLARADWRARLIKLADCYDNLSDLIEGRPVDDVLSKCRRALRLAAPDVRAGRAESVRGARALRRLMAMKKKVSGRGGAPRARRAAHRRR